MSSITAELASSFTLFLSRATDRGLQFGRGNLLWSLRGYSLDHLQHREILELVDGVGRRLHPLDRKDDLGQVTRSTVRETCNPQDLITSRD